MNNITHNFDIQHGRPVIKSTRVPVDIVLGSLAGGMSYDDITQEYGVTLEQVRSCLAYAAELISSESIISYPNP